MSRWNSFAIPAGIAVAALLSPLASAQTGFKLPRASQAASVAQTLGTSRVSIEYHRPGVKGRVIWGDLVPYGAVWRTGANEATTLELSHPAKVAGHDVPAGKYAFFAIPEKQRWTLILNAQHEQWGAFFHDAAKDVLRFEVEPQVAPFTEWMTFAIDPVAPGTATVRLSWERLQIGFQVEFDVRAIVLAEIEAALAKAKPDEWATYFKAAKYYHENDLAPDQALAWVDKAHGIKASFSTLELKARILHRAGRTAEALPLLEQAIELATGVAPKEYVDSLRALAAEYSGAARK
jgi:hypothetical protein